MIARLSVLCFLSFFSLLSFAEDTINVPIDEFEFIKVISGKDKQFIENNLGKPDSKQTRENEGGEVEFWVYKGIVKIAGTENLYKYTQVGIVNNAVETVGNTNLKQ